jgi:hypothetical protein
VEKQNVFIAVGGSGTKVAEALVRLLAIGFPTVYQDKGGELVPTSAGETLQIWRVDPDSNSGASHELDRWVMKYRELQDKLEDHWAMSIPRDVIDLDPLVLPKRGEGDNIVKSLKGVLDSPIPGKESSRPFLDLFFEEKDLDIQVDRGFYQKPFIGSAVMALFAETLLDPSSSAGGRCDFKALEEKDVRFFLCGSLHGGTGACGVPILGRFLKKRKDEKIASGKWQLGGCLLGPYHRPPDLPFSLPKERGILKGEEIKNLIKANQKHPAFQALSDPGKEELAKQILLGFYADPEAMPKRASHSLSYYESSVIAKCFDELFLVGKPRPDSQDEGAREKWSNGGASQSNPLNSAEVVGAIAALNFFSGTLVSRQEEEIYTVGSSTTNLDSYNVKLNDLPHYNIEGKTPIDPERVFLASAITRHLIIHELPWDKLGASFPSEYALRKLYEKAEDKKIKDKDEFDQASALLIEFMKSTIDPQSTLGWSPEVASKLFELLATDKRGVEQVQEKLKKPGWRDKWKKRDPNLLGESKVTLEVFEFVRWMPKTSFNRGDYWRHIWSSVYKKIEEAGKAQAAAA